MIPTKTHSRSEILKRFFTPVAWFKWIYIGLILWWLIHWWLALWLTHLLRLIVDEVQSGQLWNITLYIWIIVLLWIIYWVNVYISAQYTLSSIIPTSNRDLMKEYMWKFLHLSSLYVEKIWSWKRINIIERWVEAWSHLLESIWWNFTKVWSRIVFSLLYIVFIDLKYGIFAMLVVLLVMYIHYKLQDKAFLHRRDRKDSTIWISRTVVRQIQSHIEILQADREKNELKTYNVYADEILNSNKRIMRFNGWGQFIAKSLIDILRVWSVLLVTYWLYWNYVSIAEFVSLMMILSLLDWTIWQATRMYVDMLREYVHIEKLRDVFDAAPESLSCHIGKEIVLSKWNINIKSLNFWYSQDMSDLVFSNFSLEFAWGKRTALVGMSWSWKSTLVKLIAWYLKPNWGSVVVDDQDLLDVSLKSYYKHIGYLTQEPSVFDGTVWENLTYAVDETTVNKKELKKKVDAAIKHAKCEFVYDFNEWLDTEIGEKGIRLSWGQRQRLAIAKIFIKDPEIIILDEPTSALDSFSEEWITEAMHNLFDGRTVIIIAHRLQTVKEADDIILLDEGKVVERGTHDELVNQWGQYAKMLELQSWF